MKVGEKMKSKITKFIMKAVTMLIAVIIMIIGIMIYEEISKTNISDEVQEFVSNITISSGETSKSEIQTPQVL